MRNLLANKRAMVMVMVMMAVIVMSVFAISILSQSLSQSTMNKGQLDQIMADQLAKGEMWRRYGEFNEGTFTANSSSTETRNAKTYSIGSGVSNPDGAGIRTVLVDISF
jgi:Tfp pilus assembly protein PilX